MIDCIVNYSPNDQFLDQRFSMTSEAPGHNETGLNNYKDYK